MESYEAIKHVLSEVGTTHIIVVIGALLGSIKTSMVINAEASICDKWLDVMLGLFCGIMAGYHFSNELNVYITGLNALLGGIGGAIIIEVIIELLPKATKQIITNYLKGHKK